jgi:hypothetical protein
MFCPHCGQQQLTDPVRFCSRCGFPMEGATQLVRSGGILPNYAQSNEPKEISPRRRGVKQGGVLFLTGALLVPILGVLTSFSSAAFLEILTAVAAIICFLGGPLRMLYAALFEEGAPQRPYMMMGPPMGGASVGPYTPPVPPARNVPAMHTPGALPPAPANRTAAWKPRPTTAELPQPPSVTENTTRLLDKEDVSER